MKPSVTEFYDGKSIFITGGTGFVGKILIEKLLRCCPGIKAIYLLMRQKKDITIEENLKNLCDNNVFDFLRNENPEVFKKLKVVAGDVMEEDLGISNDDRRELQKCCNILFHSAASVRFDQNIKVAVQMNTIGTLKVLQLAETMEKLEAYVHISTAYCRCELPVFDEKLYPAVHPPRKVIDIVEWMDDKTLEHLEPKLISLEPNTYSYTKAITEELVAEYSSKFPIAIGRPSIVTAAWKEPLPGWVDNKLNGVTGMIVACSKGVLHSMNCEPYGAVDAIPVDVVANGCILIAYATALEKSKDVRIYNMTLSGVIKKTWNELAEVGIKYIRKYPTIVALWYPQTVVTRYWLLHQTIHFLTQFLTAHLIDTILYLLGKEPFLVKIQNRVSSGTRVLLYYTNKKWIFINKNFLSLKKLISKEENDVFFTDLSKLDLDFYVCDYILGVRKYIFKEGSTTLPRARTLHKIRYIIHVITLILLSTLFVWILYKSFGIFRIFVSS